ncbi:MULTISPECIES: hypothetical protein [unclassified Nostoc]|nr:hypothetical protein [Nostoc sp. ChiQUE02]MDZ8233233.1 hypothetical protein [Nostoc sp. ChiQUE02]
MAVPVDSAALASLLPKGDAKGERASGGLPNPKGLGVSPSGASGVESTGV